MKKGNRKTRAKKRRRKRKSRKKRKVARKKSYKREVIHPYLGFVIEYGDTDCPDFGFCDNRTRGKNRAPFVTKNDDNFIIAILGGSFAHQLPILSSKGILENMLGRFPQLRGKEIVIIPIALGGYKQPQQLMALNYFLSLGAHFDIVINVDGFNEVALPAIETYGKGIYPFFPRMWNRRVAKVTPFELLSLAGSMAYFKKKQRRWSERFIDSPLRYSVIGNLVWQLNNNRWARKLEQAENSFTQYKQSRKKTKSSHRYVAKGPAYEFSTKDRFYEDLATNWARSSLQMAYVSQAYGAKYFHFLQPNQYFENSKPMTAEEREAAIFERHPYRQGVIRGYPKLIDEGRWLQERGVDYHDLTMIFARNEEVLYRDHCCHLNQRGYDLVLEKIGTVILSSYGE